MMEPHLKIDVPGWGSMRLRHLLLDFTGTLSKSGELLAGVQERLCTLAGKLRITVSTADTFGKARQALSGLTLDVRLVRNGRDKLRLVTELGPDAVVAIGNGRNDVPMVEASRLGIAVIGPEGAAAEPVRTADVLVTDIHDALDLLIEPLRLVATLRE